MCGRFVRHTNVRELTRLAGALDAPPDPGPSYNVAPSQKILSVRCRDEGRILDSLTWGLVPRWAKEPKKIHPINARAETVARNGVFRIAFRTGRVLIPADGFFEWKRTEHGKQPFYICRRDGQPMWFAGVSDTWRGDESSLLESCAIITTTANEMMRPIHNRMPVILFEEEWNPWLDSANRDAEEIKGLLRPCAADRIEAYPVSRQVNSPKNNRVELNERTD